MTYRPSFVNKKVLLKPKYTKSSMNLNPQKIGCGIFIAVRQPEKSKRRENFHCTLLTGLVAPHLQNSIKVNLISTLKTIQTTLSNSKPIQTKGGPMPGLQILK